jgi:flavin reductase (DIM6/NTAB) family NADH-FMN oxidoreductase RutF
MNPPHSEAVVDVRKEDVDRFQAAGWTEVKSEKKSTGSRSSKK